MTSTEVTSARGTTPVLGAGVLGALLVLGGLLPGWSTRVTLTRDLVTLSEYTGASYRLIGHAAWPYYTALALALGGLTAAALLVGRGPTALAPAVLTLTAAPAFAFVVELWEPHSYYAPYAEPARRAEQEARAAAGTPPGDAFASLDIQVEPGGWITFATLLLLAVGATVWLGRSLDVLARPWAALATLGGILVAAFAGYATARSVSETASCFATPIDQSDVSPDWGLFLVLVVPGSMVGVGIGAMSRSRWSSGWLLVAAAAALVVALGVIGLELLGPCLDDS